MNDVLNFAFFKRLSMTDQSGFGSADFAKAEFTKRIVKSGMSQRLRMSFYDSAMAAGDNRPVIYVLRVLDRNSV